MLLVFCGGSDKRGHNGLDGEEQGAENVLGNDSPATQYIDELWWVRWSPCRVGLRLWYIGAMGFEAL